MKFEAYNLEHKMSLRLAMGETIPRIELDSVDVDLIARYLTTIKTNSNIVLKQLKAFKEG